MQRYNKFLKYKRNMGYKKILCPEILLRLVKNKQAARMLYWSGLPDADTIQADSDGKNGQLSSE